MYEQNISFLKVSAVSIVVAMMALLTVGFLSPLQVQADTTQPVVTLAFETSSVSVVEGHSITVDANLSKIYDKQVVVNLSFSGTASMNTDYTVSKTQLVLNAGTRKASTVISTIDDTLVEGQESILVAISSATNATLGTPRSLSIRVVEDDNPPTSIKLSASKTSLSENGDATTITATLSQAMSDPVVLNLVFFGQAEMDSDYTVSSEKLTIAAGATSGSVTLSTIDNEHRESLETIVVGVARYSGVLRRLFPVVILKIIDDDPDGERC